jgi:NAD(P)-dependent dehydrogenase (short-subunit alcohol dehydrogenase family)
VARLQDKVALVIGAGSAGPGWGNGKAAAVLFAREGAKVFAVDVNAEAAAETAGIIADEGGTALSHAADVSRADQVEALVGRCVEAFGRVDVLHNNVGIVEVGGPVELSEASWERINAVNVTSFYLTCKHVLPIMEHQGGGAIVNLSSVAAIRYTGVPYIAYNTTKAAIIGFTRGVALQYADKGIRCNAILPGLMKTPMIVEPLKDVYGAGDVEKMYAVRDAQCPMGHMGDAWDVAHAALFLASDEAKYITGQGLVVDGGLTLKYA